MVSTIEERKEWFARGVAEGKTHMVVVCDSFDYSNYPVFVPANLEGAVVADPRVVYEHYRRQPMQRVMEVFDLRKDPRPQFDCKGLCMEGLRALEADD